MHRITLAQNPATLVESGILEWLETQVLADYITDCRWFSSKAKTISEFNHLDNVVLSSDGHRCFFILFTEVGYSDQTKEAYCLPLLVRKPASTSRGNRSTTLAELHVAGSAETWHLQDALSTTEGSRLLLEIIVHGTSIAGGNGRIQTTVSPADVVSHQHLEVIPITAEQSNSSVRFGDELILKVYRRLQEGINPDIELGLHLTRQGFRHIAAVKGVMDYTDRSERKYSIALLQNFIPNQGDAWYYTLDSLTDYFSQCAPREVPAFTVLNLLNQTLDSGIQDRMGNSLDSAGLLGKRTAQLHLALSRHEGNPDFRPERFSRDDQQKFAAQFSNQINTTLSLIEDRFSHLPNEVQGFVQRIRDTVPMLKRFLDNFESADITSRKSRCHGDFHLGQVLVHEGDFVIIDFEGEPKRLIEERRQKHLPLRDVAGLIRSLNYVVFSKLNSIRNKMDHPSDSPDLENTARFWNFWVSAKFLQTYLKLAQGAPFIPADRCELRILLDIFLLERAFYELEYEMNNRPHWVSIPVQGILELLQEDQ